MHIILNAPYAAHISPQVMQTCSMAMAQDVGPFKERKHLLPGVVYPTAVCMFTHSVVQI